MEPVSLAFGAASLVPVVLRGLQKCVEIYVYTKDLPHDILRFKGRFIVQHGIFRRQCRYMLESIDVASSDAENMVADFGHPNWSDDLIRVQLYSLGEDFQMVLADIKESIDAIELQLESYCVMYSGVCAA